VFAKSAHQLSSYNQAIYYKLAGLLASHVEGAGDSSSPKKDANPTLARLRVKQDLDSNLAFPVSAGKKKLRSSAGATVAAA
jgi:hypothetical protein